MGILGATGTVGQRFIELLNNHPWFTVTVLGGSEKSIGKKYEEACRHWKLESSIPDPIKEMLVNPCKPSYFADCHCVFSALDSSVASEIETDFVENEIPVFSNAKNHRMDKDVPLIVPMVNENHIELLHNQRKLRGLRKGFLVCNANCSTTGLVVALKAIEIKYGIERLIVNTMQAISGAGYPGVSSFDILDNVVPFISGEEDKIETEPLKILGNVDHENNCIKELSFDICANCNRVSVLDGHTESVVIKLKAQPNSIDELKETLQNYSSESQRLKLPSAPKLACVVLEEDDRPQPRLDRNKGNGFTVTIGRIRKSNSNAFDFKFTLLSHNTILGAAGSAILNAELAKLKGFI